MFKSSMVLGNWINEESIRLTPADITDVPRPCCTARLAVLTTIARFCQSVVWLSVLWCVYTSSRLDDGYNDIATFTDQWFIGQWTSQCHCSLRQGNECCRASCKFGYAALQVMMSTRRSYRTFWSWYHTTTRSHSIAWVIHCTTRTVINIIVATFCIVCVLNRRIIQLVPMHKRFSSRDIKSVGWVSDWVIEYSIFLYELAQQFWSWKKRNSQQR